MFAPLCSSGWVNLQKTLTPLTIVLWYRGLDCSLFAVSQHWTNVHKHWIQSSFLKMIFARSNNYLHNEAWQCNFTRLHFLLIALLMAFCNSYFTTKNFPSSGLTIFGPHSFASKSVAWIRFLWMMRHFWESLKIRSSQNNLDDYHHYSI